jgi:hypothetical protein
MGVPLSRPAALAAQLEAPVEEWPYLDEGTLVKARSRKVCIPMSTLQRSVLVLDATLNGCRCSSGERYRATINHKRL